MVLSIRFSRSTVNSLRQRWQAAYAAGDLPVVQRVTALLELAHGTAVAPVAEAFAVTRQTVYNWLQDLLVQGLDSLEYRRSPGRKPRLTPAQQQRLVALVKAGPLAAGYLTACWTALLVQQLIQREFGVLYNRHYVCALLRNLGFSFQQAREEALKSQEIPPPTMREVARRLGYDQSYLLKRFRALCQAISKRCLDYRREKAARRTSELCDEIRRVTLEIHKIQGIK